MKISDFDIYHLPPLMGMFVDYIENECERLLQESPQFTELQREDHELLDEYPFLNMITDSNGVTKALDLNYAETEALAKFCLVEDDINCWKRLQMYLLGIAYAIEIIELLKLDYQKHGACIGEETMLICYKQTEEKEDTEKERGDTMAENTTKELDFDRKHEEDLQRLRGLRLLDDDFMQKVINVIEANLANEDFSVQMLAERLNMSQPTLYRKIKERSELSIIKVIRSIRMSKAASLIMEHKYSVLEISEMVGFNDPNTFRKHFIEQFGVLPSKYDERSKGGEIDEQQRQ